MIPTQSTNWLLKSENKSGPVFIHEHGRAKIDLLHSFWKNDINLTNDWLPHKGKHVIPMIHFYSSRYIICRKKIKNPFPQTPDQLQDP